MKKNMIVRITKILKKMLKIKYLILNKIIIILLILIIQSYIYFISSKENIIMNNNQFVTTNQFVPSSDINNSIILKEKESLLKYISKSINKNISNLKTIFLDYKCHFGNQIILLNKVIFICEILGCKRIILNKDIYWFIKTKIIYKKFKMCIEVGDEKDYIKKNIIIDRSNNFFWFFNYIKPKFRTEILKEEILRNLPKKNTDPNTLFIYIRSGDIFTNELMQFKYFQPPLCFYHKILNTFEFQNIVIIAEDKKNPVIDKLLIEFPSILYKNNSLIDDISYLLYGYNIVGAYSTFLINILRFNDNIKLLWYYEFSESFFFTYEFNHKNINIFKMKTSDFYYDTLNECNTLQCIINIMLNYECKYNFIVR